MESSAKIGWIPRKYSVHWTLSGFQPGAHVRGLVLCFGDRIKTDGPSDEDDAVCMCRVHIGSGVKIERAFEPFTDNVLKFEVERQEHEQGAMVCVIVPIARGDNEVQFGLAYHCNVSDSPFGLYSSAIVQDAAELENNRFVCTQFEPMGARRAVPCLDEPWAKAVWEVRVSAPLASTVLSNMALKTKRVTFEDDDDSKKGKVEDYVFEPTPPMASYLLAMVAAPPNTLRPGTSDVTSHGTVITTWCFCKEDIPKTKLANQTIMESVESMGRLVDYPFSAMGLSKLDAVPIHDFDSGAMENWGLMTFRPAALMCSVDEDHVGSGCAPVVQETVAHEVAHQWFGNLITPGTWWDLWLNEGFATLCAAWIQAGSISPPESGPGTPEYAVWQRVWQKFLEDDVPGVMHSRAVIASHDAAVKPTEGEAMAMFDGATYVRAAATLRMVFLYVGEMASRLALATYVRIASRPGVVATESMLWSCFGEDAAELGRSWLRHDFSRGFKTIGDLPRLVVDNWGEFTVQDDAGSQWTLASRTVSNTDNYLGAMPVALPMPASCVSVEEADQAVMNVLLRWDPLTAQAALNDAVYTLQEGSGTTVGEKHLALLRLKNAAAGGNEFAALKVLMFTEMVDGSGIVDAPAPSSSKPLPSTLESLNALPRSELVKRLRAMPAKELQALYCACSSHEALGTFVAFALGKVAAKLSGDAVKKIGEWAIRTGLRAQDVAQFIAGVCPKGWQWLQKREVWTELFERQSKFGRNAVLAAAMDHITHPQQMEDWKKFLEKRGALTGLQPSEIDDIVADVQRKLSLRDNLRKLRKIKTDTTPK